MGKKDLVIIGAGLAGSAAACFAARQGLKVMLVGWTRGELPFSSGAIDLISVYPIEEARLWQKPWDALERLVAGHPEHPYSRCGLPAIREALERFGAMLDAQGFPYAGFSDANAALATSAGSLKRSFLVPRSMWPGVAALAEKQRVLIVEFEGMKEFSATQMVEVLGSKWPGLAHHRMRFPQPFPGWDRHNLLLAEAMESADVRAAVAEGLLPHLGDAQAVAFPAVLGIRRPTVVTEDLETRLGRPVFEIPGMPPSVPGQRLIAALDQAMQQYGVELRTGTRALRIETSGKRCTHVVVGEGTAEEKVETRGVILATGRFFGGGLVADLTGIREPLLNLPVRQPKSREEWHREDFLDSRGHPLNRSGLAIDTLLRPLDARGEPALENLAAAGTILAHQDWIREKSGSGISIATAFKAVETILREA